VVFSKHRLPKVELDLAHLYPLYKKVKGLKKSVASIGLARIIHQPEKSTREGDFVVQMNPKTTVS
jgi:hypothetical protein